MTFVTKKITKAVANIKKGRQAEVVLGNINTKRDWGHAKDYVSAMWLMLQQDAPADYVIASGETYTVKDFIERAFAVVDIKVYWRGAGVEEIGINQADGSILVRVDPKYYRPAEVEFLHGDPSLAKRALGWKPTYSFDDLISEMVLYDMKYDDYGWDRL